MEKKMKRKEYCDNFSCETNNILSAKFHTKTLIPIYYNSYYTLKRGKKETKTRVNSVAFYVCKECSIPSEFSKIPFKEIIYNLKVNFIPRSYTERFNDLITSKKTPECLFCEQTKVKDYFIKKIDEKTSQRVPIIKKCVLKLFLKESREYVGFLCGSCKMIYFSKKFTQVNWDIAYKDQEVDVLANASLSKSQLNKMGLGEKKKIELFDSIGSFSTSEGIKERPKQNKVTLPFLTVTIKQAKTIIEKYGSAEQKEAFMSQNL